MNSNVNMLPPFVSTRRAVRALGFVFGACAAVSWVAVGYDFGEMRLAGTLVDGANLQAHAREAHSIAGQLVGVLQLALFVATAGFFLVWLHRVRVNVRALGARHLSYGREWTVLAFLIPIINITRPYVVISEVWRASDPACGDAFEWRARKAPPLLGLWWSTLVGFVGLWMLSTTLLEFATGLERIQLAHAIAMAADMSAAISASLAWFVVHGISDAQETKHALFGPGGVPASVPFDPRDALVST